ncbi:MAG: tRNA preQ1(34) S-adenosylmethionine ribosyltransferase-isomerase QueA [Candidatus Paceibacterota bacterium]|jgi:S-adenosylmethionine:tRNA ribosyltransferase-isomerase|nr:tRNA preQ1(34) S-adenosylmethionine ribosyltransferase-isomerase QueA [Candidatus Paceibacterota bacterium]
MENLDEIVSKYDYAFDPTLIANEPASPRDSAKLLAYDRKTGTPLFDTFANIGNYLPKGAVLVLNDTKVFPARLHCTKKTGGRVEIFYLGSDGRTPPQSSLLKRGGGTIRALTNHFLDIGEKVFLNDTIFFEVMGKEDKIYTLRPSFPIGDVQKVFKKYGETPIPPYIKNTKLSETQLREKYQTVFAKNTGSVAAPTASLHFTKRLLAKLKKQGIQIEFVTLHVNLGTFAPLTEEALKTGKLHKEWYEIPEKTAKALMKAKKEGRPIIAVGTTAVRTLEEWVNSPRGRSSGSLPRTALGGNGETRLFIRPGYKFRFVDGMITNFHVPKSSLLMLVSAFVGREKLLELYQEAMRKNFRFFSFGDGMLLL